jgi:hypothetical protein
MKKSIAVAAVATAVMTAGTATAFAARVVPTGHAAPANPVRPAKPAQLSTINKFVWGPYMIIVRYVKDDPLPKRFDVPLTLRAGAEQDATPSQIAMLQRSYLPVAQGSIQVLMRQADPKVVKHVQRHLLVHAHAHVNTGFGGEARQVVRHFPYSAGRNGR